MTGLILADDLNTIYHIETWRLQEVKDPFFNHVWSPLWTVSRSAVEDAIAEGRLEASPWSIECHKIRDDFSGRTYHEERIAYLIVNPAPDPINIEVIDRFGATIIHDGHHRLTAAIFRGDQSVKVDYGGYVAAFERRFVLERSNSKMTIE